MENSLPPGLLRDIDLLYVCINMSSCILFFCLIERFVLRLGYLGLLFQSCFSKMTFKLVGEIMPKLLSLILQALEHADHSLSLGSFQCWLIVVFNELGLQFFDVSFELNSEGFCSRNSYILSLIASL